MTAQATLAFDESPASRLQPRAPRAARGRPARSAAAEERGAPCEPAHDPAWTLGWDHARHGVVPPAEHLLPGHPLRDGWLAGRAAFGTRTLKATLQVRQWLQLRVQAWSTGQAFEEIQVTPNFVAQLGRPRCPVTRTPLTVAVGAQPRDDDDATVTRLNESAGYAAGNLAMLSRRAAAAKAGQRWSDARLHAVLTQARAGQRPNGGALSTAEWARLAVLMSFATPLPHELAAQLPLLVLPPNRLRLVNPIQGLQALVTQQLRHAGFAARISQLVELLPGWDARRAFHLFFHTLLARAWQGGRATDAQDMVERLEDAWQEADVLRRWQGFARHIGAELADRILQRLATPAQGRPPLPMAWHPPFQATEGWALERGGATPHRPLAQAAHRASPNPHRRVVQA